MLSSLTSKDAEMTEKAIRLGADDFMLKPRDIPHVRDIADEMTAKIRHLVTLVIQPGHNQPVDRPARPAARRVVLIGSSAGGPPMLDSVLGNLPSDLPASVVITQHMPVGFTASLAARFERIANMPVKETENGDLLETGRVLVSKAGFHTIVSTAITENGTRTGKIVHARTPPLHGVRPAVDKTFESAAQVFGKSTVSVILSGMGNDAGEGAYAIRQAGGVSIACEEKDCLVYGMVRSALSRNAVDLVLPLEKIPGAIEQAVLHMEEEHV
jgi:two-component system chemotaxis response regulator CheB